jgi:hypothetical protein
MAALYDFFCSLECFDVYLEGTSKLTIVFGRLKINRNGGEMSSFGPYIICKSL